MIITQELSCSLHHIGIAVNAIEPLLDMYVQDFGFLLEHREKVDAGFIEAVYLKSVSENSSRIELIAPAHEEEKVIRKFLNKKGEGLHHICYEVADLEEALFCLGKKGYQLIDAIPRKGAMNKLVAFIHPSSCKGVLTELCQSIER
jgi:methylmalonyl-CoA/ethylmalonyl-CoA epimerase